MKPGDIVRCIGNEHMASRSEPYIVHQVHHTKNLVRIIQMDGRRLNRNDYHWYNKDNFYVVPKDYLFKLNQEVKVRDVNDRLSYIPSTECRGTVMSYHRNELLKDVYRISFKSGGTGWVYCLSLESIKELKLPEWW